MSKQTPKKIAIVGSGLVGTLLGIYLKKRGHIVHVYDRSPDIRKINFCTNTELNSLAINESLQAISFLKNPQIKVIVVSNNLSFLSVMHDAGFQVAYEINENSDFLASYSMYNFVKEIIVKNKNCTKDQITQYQTEGIRVTIFEMRSAVGIRKALKKMPNSIITDDVREAIIEVN